MVLQTVDGLRDQPDATTEADIAQWAIATGTANIIEAVYSPAVTGLVDGMILGFRALLANTTTTPTFAPNGLTAHTIVKRGASALAVGDIDPLGEYLVRYNEANERWVLLNPQT